MSYHIKARKAKKLDTKFIFVSGGVISSVGKGITTASLAMLLESRGYKVAPVKMDMYLNVDAGTIRPQEHGEVFVTKDGVETDQDVGNYERFMNTDLYSSNYVTNGQIYQKIIQKERNFEYDGEDVEIVPHVPEEIIARLEKAAHERKADFVIAEIGGTVGEYQNVLYMEANRIMKYRDGRDVIHVHVGYLPTPPSVGEMKSKPVQTSVRILNGSGIQPDFLVCRAEQPVDDRRKQTLAWITSVPAENIISAPNVDTINRVPLNFDQQKFTDKILAKFGLKSKKQDLKKWKNLTTKISKINSSRKEVEIAVVGKYYETGAYKLADVYISVVEAIKHASWNNGVRANFNWVSSVDVEKKGAKKVLSKYDGIVVPGGFGARGTEGMISTIEYARENNIPYLGLCYGMQMATIEFARNVAGLKGANTTEVDKDAPHPIIHIMPDQEKKLLKREYGATMRLGGWDCVINRGTKVEKEYLASGRIKKAGKAKINERHRHRYEFNNNYREKLEKAGLVIAGTTPDGHLVEIIELKNHPYFVASQFHPEFQSRPLDPHPLFNGLLKAILKNNRTYALAAQNRAKPKF
ncbi:MAG: CTP synthase [Candidatus Doudnabacteria bacterium CG10_big_fil_rev_8_21_14_0_10_42_18]|uniref:CTP synthase n=1 Tax=Candidatus Doudnabacteria bacterium CG10_big_fil_rev_8_21_14_0_10_42_18 TaxID=1974552 RepID=A0A2H0VAL0_9BACT|nr:MAG: CTP synthase [Candidatus Doudnabacteria bacterium CG10_big_fil_rev_8_21_14_0_10_42_18]